jgi:hypothetical protein
MSKVEDVLEATLAGPAALDNWLAAYPSEVTPALATSLHTVALDFGSQRLAQGVALASMAEAQVYRKLNAIEPALEALAMHLEATFAMAESGALYTHVLESAVAVAGQAIEAGLRPLAFRMRVVAADCAFWTAEGAQDPDAKARWLLRGLAELDEAARAVASPADLITLERYASVVMAILKRSRDMNWGARAPQVERLRQALAGATERFIPVDYTFPNSPEKTEYGAAILAELSSEYGNPQIASRRLFTKR